MVHRVHRFRGEGFSTISFRACGVRQRKGFNMKWTVVSLVLLFGGGVAAEAWAQGGNGSLRGIVKDAQGGALPGVTMTATSPALLGATSAVSDADGTYRVINLVAPLIRSTRA